MPWPVYSERLLASAGVNGQVSYYVPTRMRAVVRHIAVDTGDVSSGFIVVGVGPVNLYTLYIQAARQVRNIDVMGVAYQGEVIRITTTGAGMACAVFGYLFDDPSGRIAAPPGAATKPIEPGRPGPEPLPSSEAA